MINFDENENDNENRSHIYITKLKRNYKHNILIINAVLVNWKVFLLSSSEAKLEAEFNQKLSNSDAWLKKKRCW